MKMPKTTKKTTAKDASGFSKPPIRKKPFKYLREVSVVIIGVAVTFIGSDWISNRKAKNDLERYLHAVKIELQDNLKNIREKAEFYKNTGELARYLWTDKPENLDPDTLEYLSNQGDYGVINGFFTLTNKSSAFEMLKSSGTMHLISDNELFQSIMASYAEMERIKNESDNYMSRKMDILYQTVMSSQQLQLDLQDPKFREIYYFFAIYIDLDNVLEEGAKQIEETLSLL